MPSASWTASPSPTKSSTDLGACPAGELAHAVDVPAVGLDTVWCAPHCSASFSASGLRSTAMISAGVSAPRHWMPMWPSPPAPITTALLPGSRTGTVLRTAW